MDSHKRSTRLERLEVVETGCRRRWSDDEKLRIVTESFEVPRAISSTARRHGISRSLLMTRRRSFPNVDDQPSGNHESLRKQNPKSQESAAQRPAFLQNRILYRDNFCHLSGRSAFFTGDRGAAPRGVFRSIRTALLGSSRPTAREGRGARWRRHPGPTNRAGQVVA